jgi:hypothetical protein
METASELLETLEYVLLATPPAKERREDVVAPLLAAHERLWNLKSGNPAVRTGSGIADIPMPAAHLVPLAASRSEMMA